MSGEGIVPSDDCGSPEAQGGGGGGQGRWRLLREGAKRAVPRGLREVLEREEEEEEIHENENERKGRSAKEEVSGRCLGEGGGGGGMGGI